MYTHSEENYLKAIYLLEIQGNEKVSATVLAALLRNNPASVIDMLKKLTDKKLIDYDKNKGAKLTGIGLKTAVMTVRKHRLWEMFLQEKLGYGWDEVHDIAEQLEHIEGENLADRLDEFLGHPQFDPHGEAIPKSDGQIQSVSDKTLKEIKPGNSCTVVSVKDTSKSFLQYLRKLEIGIGTIIRVIEKIEFDSSITILINDKQQTNVSEKFSESVFVINSKS
jgi:DtxR family transcriptional regulator, Mn-dependent transcriptional regulator